MRTFETGATRDTDANKHDYEGYLSPLALRRFGEYMTKHRVQADGNVRASDNWQKGIPQDQYIKSLIRHVLDVWTIHRGYEARDEKGNVVDLEDALAAILFNVQGYLHEHLKGPRVTLEPPGMPSTFSESMAEQRKQAPWWTMLTAQELQELAEMKNVTPPRTPVPTIDLTDHPDRDEIIKYLVGKGLIK